MKLRPLFLLRLLVGGILVSDHAWVTWCGRIFAEPFFASGRAWLVARLELKEAEAAPEYHAEEQQYLRSQEVLLSVVNITSNELALSSYGTVPQQGQGSGFILGQSRPRADELSMWLKARIAALRCNLATASLLGQGGGDG